MTPWVRTLILMNVVAYMVTKVVPVVPIELLWFVPVRFPLMPWTIVTYMFLHGGFTHIAFNMLMLFVFGTRLETRLGTRQFLLLYFISGIMGGLLSVFFTPRVAIIGASGATFGLMLGYARYWPRQIIHLFGIVPIEARALVVTGTIIALWLGFWGGGGNTAHFAHLGGFLGAYLYLKWWDRKSPAAQFKAKARAPLRPRSSDAGADLKRWQRINRDGMHPVNQEELDRILDKISANGIGSLTAEDRDFLERFSTRQSVH